VDEQPDSPPLGVRVVGGGEPTAEELAAVVVALTPTAGAATHLPRRPSAWRRAAMIEGVGGRPPTRPVDLDVTRLRA
jgi:hypothetical protein